MCINGQNPTIETWYNQGYSPYVLDPNTKSIGLTKIKVSYANGILACTLSREISMANLDKFLDLNKLRYLIIAKGPVDGKLKLNKNFMQKSIYSIQKFSNLLKDMDIPQIHTVKTFSDSPVNFTATSGAASSSEILVQAHGNLNAILIIIRKNAKPRNFPP